MKKIAFSAGILCFMLFIACHSPYVDPDSIHTVTFSAEGGVFDNAADRISIQTDAKGRIAHLPAVTRAAFNFIGWFTPGGTRVIAQTVFHDDTLVVARWRNPNTGEIDERGPFAQMLEGFLNDPKTATLTLNAGETLGPQSFEFEGLENRIVVTLDGTSLINTLSLAGFGSLFTVGNNVTLKLLDIRLQGHGSNTASMIDIKEGGKVIIENGPNGTNGTLITGNDTESLRHGGGITVHVGAELEMSAGAIYQNSSAHMSDWLSGNIGGGGVWVRGGKFTMSGGRIEENYSIGGGGVLVTLGGTFTMSNGQIIKCISNSVGGGVRVAGYRADAVPITEINPDGRIGSTFTMIKGEIYECESSSGGGVELGWGGTFTMTGGEIYKNIGLSGGGVCNLYGIVLLYPDGKIYENTAIGEGGGLMNAGHCEMWGGDIYQNESLGPGGGVMHTPTGSGLLHNFFMYDGTIRDNTAQGGGGGLYSLASFDMYGGSITGNTAHGNGGGVLVGAPSLLLDYGELTITSGEISGNTSYASGTNNNNLAVRGQGKARTARLGLYWFKSTFEEIITEFTPSLDANGNYIFDADGRMVGTSEKQPRTFGATQAGTPVTKPVPTYIGHRDEGIVGGDYSKPFYFISTPLVKPSGSGPYTPETRAKVQGSFRIAIGDPTVEIITETQPVPHTFEVIVMDMDAAKFAINVQDGIIVVDGVVQP